ncbi:MAG: coenzyme F420-0:L-glutamate ligase [Candidatus Helarchaeota archaeon]
MTFEVIGLKTDLITPNTDFFDVIIKSLNKNNIELKSGDIIVIAESALATSQGRIVDLQSIKPSKKAVDLSKKFEIDPRYVQVILNEADKIYGGVTHVLLCEKWGNLLANAGVDQSNTPREHVVLLPLLDKIDDLRKQIEELFNIQIGLIVADSRTQPLRRGVIGIAIAVSGFEPVESNIGKKDLFGNELKFTYRAIADDLATAAQIEMGESNESIPIVIIRGVKVRFCKKPTISMFMPESECLYMNVFKK